MADQTVTPVAAEPAVTNDTSIAELRSFLEPAAVPIPANGKQPLTVTRAAGSEPEATSPTPEATEPEKPVARERDEHGKFVSKAASTEAESGTAQPKEPSTEVDKDEDQEQALPPGVKKRVEKIVVETARIQAEIDRRISAKKAAQAKLDSLAAEEGTSGTEPVKNTAPPKLEGEPAMPVRPIFGEKEGETWAEYTAAVKKYETDFTKYTAAYTAWIREETRKTVAEELRDQRFQETTERTIEASKKKYGEEFDDYRTRVVEASPEGLLLEISALDDWPEMAVYLGKPENEAELIGLAALYERSHSAAIRELGRIEDRLSKAVSKEPVNSENKVAAGKPVPVDKPLPAPPERVGGGANAAPVIDLNKADMRTFTQAVQPLLKRA